MGKKRFGVEKRGRSREHAVKEHTRRTRAESSSSFSLHSACTLFSPFSSFLSRFFLLFSFCCRGIAVPLHTFALLPRNDCDFADLSVSRQGTARRGESSIFSFIWAKKQPRSSSFGLLARFPISPPVAWRSVRIAPSTFLSSDRDPPVTPPSFLYTWSGVPLNAPHEQRRARSVCITRGKKCGMDDASISR